MRIASRSLFAKFMSRARFDKQTGCWQWIGSLGGPGYREGRGYAQFTFWLNGKTKNARAARTAYETFIGPIGTGLVIDHICQNPACVNPAHLDICTQEENARRVGLRKTVCKNGHDRTPANLYVDPGGRVAQCRLCRKAAHKRSRKPKKVTNGNAGL